MEVLIEVFELRNQEIVDEVNFEIQDFVERLKRKGIEVGAYPTLQLPKEEKI